MTRRLTFTLFMLGFCLALIRGDAAASHPLVVLLVPGTSLTDWQLANAPTLHHILATGSVAVMNTRTARLPNDHHRETPESAVLTLGAGSRAAGGGEIAAFHPAQDRIPGRPLTYGTLYARRLDAVAPLGGSINAEWPRVIQENSRQGYDLLPGNLGDGLKHNGIPVRAGGGRFAPVIACDSEGTVIMVAGQGRFPHTLPRFLVWDAGADIVSADSLLHIAASEVTLQHGRLIVVSPFVSDHEYSRGQRLAPIVVWGPDVPAGLLYSPSTHRAGLVTNTDFAPSVTDYFGATMAYPWLRSPPFGHPWGFRGRTDALMSVAHLETEAYRQAYGMRFLPWGAICLGLMVLAQIVCLRIGIICQPLLWLPGVFVLALLTSLDMSYALVSLAALILVFWRLQKRYGSERLVALSAMVMVIVLIGDTLSGSRLMRSGLLGYSSVEGARYYGIGNEAMGVLVGSTLIAADTVWKRYAGRRSVYFVLLGVALLLGLPSAGAKVGGLLVSVAAFVTFAWTASGRRWNTRVAVGVVAAMTFTLVLVSLLDWEAHTGVQTHLGGAVARVRFGGVGEALDIARRKLAVEGRLLYRSTWALPLWASLLGVVLIARQQSERAVNALMCGGIAAILVSLAANDAGVIAAALCGTLVLSGLQALPLSKRPPSESNVSDGGQGAS